MQTLTPQGGMPQYDPLEVQKQRTANQTGLITLADLKAKQQAEQEFLLSVQNDPRVREALFSGSVLGSIGPAGGMPAPGGATPPGPITQSPLGGGPSQQIPAYPDASRYANVSPQGGGPIPPDVMAQTMPQVTPPQSTIASLGPAGQPQMQPGAQQNPLLEMARRDPRAAMMMQQQIEGRQDAAMKRQEQNLKLGAATLGYVGQQAQGVTDQSSLDALRSDLQGQGLGKYAAQLPQLYSKGAMEPFIAKALDVEKSLTLQIGEMTARANQIKAGLAGRTDAVNTELEIMGLAPASVSALAQQGDPQAKAQLAEATNNAEARQVRIHKAGVTPQVVEGEGGVKYLVDPHTGERRPIPGGPSGTATTGTTGTAEPMRGPLTADDKKLADYAARMERGQQLLGPLEDSGDYTSWKAPIANLPGGRMALSEKQQSYENAKGIFLQGILRRDSQGQISAQEWADYSRTYFPQPGEGPEIVKQKQQRRAEAIQEQKALLGRPAVTSPTSTSQGSTGSSKPVAQMNAEETRAEIAAIKARGGK